MSELDTLVAFVYAVLNSNLVLLVEELWSELFLILLLIGTIVFGLRAKPKPPVPKLIFQLSLGRSVLNAAEPEHRLEDLL